MSKHNYSQYYNKNNKNNKPAEEVIEEEVKVEEVETVVEPVVESIVQPEAPVVEPAVEPEVAPAIHEVGVIANCTRLNVRANPVADANVLCVVEVNSEVEIDMARSTSDWYRVITATGVDGYCMRKFVELKK